MVRMRHTARSIQSPQNYRQLLLLPTACPSYQFTSTIYAIPRHGNTRPTPEDFHPFTVLQIYKLPSLVAYPDLTFEEMLEVATHYWHTTDTIKSTTQIITKLYIPNGNKENVSIMILNHTYFTGTLTTNNKTTANSARLLIASKTTITARYRYIAR